MLAFGRTLIYVVEIEVNRPMWLFCEKSRKILAETNVIVSML